MSDLDRITNTPSGQGRLSLPVQNNVPDDVFAPKGEASEQEASREPRGSAGAGSGGLGGPGARVPRL